MIAIYFLVYLLLEVYISIEIASWIGWLFTFLEIIISGFLGIFIIMNFKYSVAESMIELVTKQITHREFLSMHIFSLIGAIFLIIPGFLSDFIGLAMQFQYFADYIASLFFKEKISKGDKKDETVIDVEVISHKHN